MEGMVVMGVMEKEVMVVLEEVMGEAREVMAVVEDVSNL